MNCFQSEILQHKKNQLPKLLQTITHKTSRNNCVKIVTFKEKNFTFESASFICQQQHCEKESTRVFDFGIEVRTAGIEVRDHSSQNGLVLQYHLFVVIYNFNTKIGSLNHIVGSS